MKVSRALTLIVFSTALDLCPRRAYGQQPRGDAGKITVAVVRATAATVTQHHPCRIDSASPVFVHSPVRGRLAAIHVKEDEAVKRGDPLFEVIPVGDGPKSPKDWEVVSVKAPCNGPVLDWHAKPGDPVGKGNDVVVLRDDNMVRVESEIPEEHYLELMSERDLRWKDADLHLILADRRAYPHVGRLVNFLGGRAERGVGYIRVAADFPNPDGVLRRGQAGTLLIGRRVPDAIVIPRRATFQGPSFRRRSERLPALTLGGRLRHSGKPIAAFLGGILARFEPADTFLAEIASRFEIRMATYVYIVNEIQVARRCEVSVEDDSGGESTAVKGICAGERIVVDGVDRVRDGDTVE